MTLYIIFIALAFLIGISVPWEEWFGGGGHIPFIFVAAFILLISTIIHLSVFQGEANAKGYKESQNFLGMYEKYDLHYNYYISDGSLSKTECIKLNRLYLTLHNMNMNISSDSVTTD